MSYRLLSLTVLAFPMTFAFASSAKAAPREFKGYCMVVHEGNPPGQEVSIQHGNTVEIAREGNVSFQVFYGDTLGEKNVLQLKTFDSTKPEQSVVDVFVGNEFPRRVDLVSAMGSISCSQP